MRKLLPCLIAVGIIAIAGCKKEGGTTSGPGVIASDDPLTFVPADTPYVMANIDPVPADVSGYWISKMDQNGKLGDIYAGQLDAAAKMLTDSASRDAIECQSQADAASIAAKSSDSSDAGSTGGDCEKNKAAARDKSLKLINAMKTEVAGKDAKGLMDLLGVSPQTHFAFYGIGLVPVLRLELAKPDNLRATIGRVETASGSKLATGKVGSLDYWIVQGDNADAKLEGVFAISGKQLVATIAPVKASDADLKTLFGLDKPAKAMGDGGDLAALNKKMNYLSYGSGYFDSARFVAVLKAPPTPLETSFLTAMGETKPTIDPVCATEYGQIAAAWPRASFGYSELSTKHMAMRGVLETRTDIAKDLETLRAPMPGMKLAQGALVDFGFSADLTKLPNLATKYAAANAATPWKCSNLASLNEEFDKSKATLTNPGFAGYAPMFHGLHVIMDKIDIKDGQPIPDLAGVVAIGSDNPASLLALAGNVYPGIATLGLKPDGVPKALPANPNLPIQAPMSAAMLEKMLAISIGTGEDAKLDDAMKTDPAQQPLLAGGARGDLYHLIATTMRNQAKNLPDPEAQKAMEQQAASMDMYANWIKRADFSLDLTDLGIEFHEAVDLQ
jgi:hypothetical protein